MRISVVVATYNRGPELANLLESLRNASLAAEVEIIVVDNGSTDRTQSVLVADWSPLNVVSLKYPVPSKAAALNTAIAIARGNLLLFTDDDVTVSPEWISAYFSACSEYPDGAIFCGPIEPILSQSLPDWITKHWLASIIFADFQPSLPCGPLPIRLSPFGPNFALKSEFLEDLRFRTDLGPSQDHGTLMCEDTEIIDRLRSMLAVHDESAKTVFLPAARVFHHVSPLKCTHAAIANRFFDLGRSHVVRFSRVTHLSRPTLLSQPILKSEQDVVASLAQLNFYTGQMFQFGTINRTAEARFLKGLLAQMRIMRYEKLLGPKAVAVISAQADQRVDPSEALAATESDLVGEVLGVLSM